MLDWIMPVYSGVISAVVAALLAWIIKLLKSQKADRQAYSKGTMLLLRVQLIEYHDEWVERGYVTKHGLDNFLAMYDSYHELGGNGLVTDLKKQVEDLPIK